VEIRAGDDAASTLIELDHESWQGLVQELEAPAGLLYAKKLRCLRGDALQIMAWEPGLRALYNGIPLYDPAQIELRERDGRPIDINRSFSLDGDREEVAHFLRTAGYLFVRGVFSRDEVACFRRESDVLRDQAVKGDRFSWWGKNSSGEEILCRVTRGRTQATLSTLPDDPRLLGLKDLAEDRLVHGRGEGDGVTVIYKNPGMVEGLGDIPWHRDCGIGGHAVTCPTLLASIYLTDATPETGELMMLPGSRTTTFNAHAIASDALTVAHFAARPGDVSLHYSDTVHAAPPPTRADLDGYRVSAVVGFSRPDARHHRGEASYNQVLHQREDGQIEHIEKVAGRVRS
jgi:hypothetical protein